MTGEGQPPPPTTLSPTPKSKSQEGMTGADKEKRTTAVAVPTASSSEPSMGGGGGAGGGVGVGGKGKFYQGGGGRGSRPRMLFTAHSSSSTFYNGGGGRGGPGRRVMVTGSSGGMVEAQRMRREGSRSRSRPFNSEFSTVSAPPGQITAAGPFNNFSHSARNGSPPPGYGRNWNHHEDAGEMLGGGGGGGGAYIAGRNGGGSNGGSYEFDSDEEAYPPAPFPPAEPEDSGVVGAVVAAQGYISLKLHYGVQVDMTVDKGVRVVNNQSQIIIALSPDGNSAALIHPSGLVYSYGSRVEIATTDCNGNTKFAKMFYKGVSFTSDTSALVYLVDQAGTRTTSDTFSDLTGDFSVPVFLHNAQIGPHMVRECTKILRTAQYWITEDGTENWVINGIRVSQTSDGLVRVGRGTSKYQIRTSPTNGTATITTPSVHTTASIGIHTGSANSTGPHLFVKRGERRLHSDGLTFIVRNAGHASGFDEFNQLKVY